MSTLIDMVAEVLPNAEAMYAGGPDPDSAVVEWFGITLVATTADDAADGYLLGVYADDDWRTGADYTISAELPNAAAVVAAMDCITELSEPEMDDIVEALAEMGVVAS